MKIKKIKFILVTLQLIILNILVFPEAMFSGGNNGSWFTSPDPLLEWTVSVKVYQWADAFVDWDQTESKYIYVKNFGVEYPGTLGSLYTRSNAKLSISVQIRIDDGFTEPNGLEIVTIPCQEIIVEGKSPNIYNPNYPNYVQTSIGVLVKAGKDTPAGSYKYVIKIILKPTIAL